MKSLESLGRIVDADVLVVGHGAAGLVTAICAKRENPNLQVVCADKAFVGFAGKANKGGGHCAFIPEGGEEQYVEYHTRNLGDYLNDQDLLRAYAHSTREILADIESWGVKIHGKEQPFNAHPMIPWKITTVDLDCMVYLGAHARKLGVKFMEKIAVTDLLTEAGRVVGAIGFSLLSGEAILFRARAVVLANGNQNWRIMRMWASGRGDGIAAAYRAGAKMRNAEFGTFINMTSVDHHMVAYGAEDHLYNAHGTSLTEFARPFMKENNNLGILGGVDLGGNHALFMYWEVQKGNGPIFENHAENGFVFSPVGRNLAPEVGRADDAWYRPKAEKFWHRIYEKKEAGYRDQKPMKEVIPGLIGECGPVYVNHEMATSVPGLYAAGDISGGGASHNGAVPTPPGRNRGTGLMNAWFMARIAGANAARYAAANEQGKVDAEQAEALQEGYCAPLKRSQGMTTDEMVWRVQNLVHPIKYTAWRHADRLNEALSEVLHLKEQLSTLVAKDAHYLAAANECRSMVLAAEMLFRASLARQESRGWFIREDYPDRDDSKLPQWVVLQKDGENMSVAYEPVPEAGFKYRPENATGATAPAAVPAHGPEVQLSTH